MSSFKKILLLGLGVILCMMFLNSCDTKEEKDKRHARETFRSIESCINEKNLIGFKDLFNSLGSSELVEADIEDLFSLFSSGITLNERPYDDYLTVTDWVDNGSYGKTICWAREITNNETGEKFILSVLECTDDGSEDDVGIIRLILYSVDDEDDFDRWWTELEDNERPNGIIQYKK